MRRTPVLVLLILLTGCLDALFESLPKEPPFPTGASFAFTSTGYYLDTLLVGTIDVVAADSGKFTGTWDLQWAAGADSARYMGLRSGHGSVDGSVSDGVASIDLVPMDSMGLLRLRAHGDSVGWHGGWTFRQGNSIFRRGAGFTARLLP